MALFKEFKKGDLIGTYVVDEYVNRGGMAWVVRAYGRSERPYALKISRVGLGEERDQNNNIAIRDEATLLSQINHGRIARIYPIQRREGGRAHADVFYAKEKVNGTEAWFFSMEYLEGGTLAEYIKRVGPISVPEAANIIGNICLGLNYLHHNRLVHLDVKAENVAFRSIIRKDEVFDPVLIDFGTAAGVIEYTEELGTYSVMPPERIRLARGIDAPEKAKQLDLYKTEIWSIGVLLYYALTNKYPFPSNNVGKLTSQILNDAPTVVSAYNREVPDEMDKFIVNECLNKDPGSRPTIQDVLRFLKPYGSGPIKARKALV